MKMKEFNGQVVLKYLAIVLGTLIAAASINLFLLPNNIVAGGVSGLATVIHSLVPIPVGAMMLAIDIPLFIFGFKNLGGSFGMRTIFASVLFSLFVDATSFLPLLTTDSLLASIYGGAMMGLGLAIVFRMGATSGGSDLAAKIISGLIPHFTVSQALFVIDGIIIILAGVVFKNMEVMLYAIIAIFVSSKIITIVSEGVNYTRAVYIISDYSDQIAHEIMNKLERGVTTLYGKGNYSGEEKDVLLCVVRNYELAKIRKTAKAIDENAFIILTEAKEVFGEGFKNK